MGIFEELADELGVGQGSPEAQLAADLAAADELFMCQLVDLRRLAGLTQEELGAAWGRHKTAVSQFERPGADPRLSTIRRYAASIGATYVHYVALDHRIHPHHRSVWDSLKSWSPASELAEGGYEAVEPGRKITFVVTTRAESSSRRASISDELPGHV